MDDLFGILLYLAPYIIGIFMITYDFEVIGLASGLRTGVQVLGGTLMAAYSYIIYTKLFKSEK